MLKQNKSNTNILQANTAIVYVSAHGMFLIIQLVYILSFSSISKSMCEKLERKMVVNFEACLKNFLFTIGSLNYSDISGNL